MTIPITATLSIPDHEIEFQFTRSSGPGGQNVNKVSTRVELLFNVSQSPSLTPDQKTRILSKLATRIDSSGILHIASQESRSQWKNRESVLEKFAELLRAGLTVSKKRQRTKPSRSAKEKRHKVKKSHSTKKVLRRKPRLTDE